LYNLQQYFADLYMHNSSVLTELTKDQSYENSLLFALQVLSFFYSFSLAFWYGAWLIKEEDMSYETHCVVLFTVFSSCIGIAIANAIAPDLKEGVDAVNNFTDKIVKQPEIDSYGKTGQQIQLKGKLQFNNLSFKYPSREARVLSHLSFTLMPGQSLGICGSTGSGKSTIAMLILRMYDPQSGEVVVDDADIKSLNVKSLRSQLGWVPQEPVLFEGDLRFNMKIGRTDATDEEMEKALIAAQAWPFVEEKGGLECEVNYRSQNFSGGQKQRLALARALLRKPALMILDEGTSALDTESEGRVLDEIRKLRCTVVNIAHRLTTIKHSDKIIVVELGKLVEEGNHESLMTLNQHYARLVGAGSHK
jgi:ABC-type multidrug transport system fused ATPase/permease subunit